MSFKEEIQLISQKIFQNKDLITNEEGTKQFLIIDFIEALGYNTRDPAEFQPEYGSGYGNKQGHRVDYAILKEGKPIVFIEAKPITKSLEEHDEQLEYYFNNNLTAKLGILTNGDDYWFFTDLENDNRMDKRPFLKIRVSCINDKDIENVQKLKKENYNEVTLSSIAEQLHYATEINAKVKELLTNPPDDFIRDLIKKICSVEIISLRRKES